MQPARRIATAISLVTSVSVTAAASSTDVSYLASAYSTATGSLLYTEHHAEVWRDGQMLEWQVEYRSAAGEVIARKRLDPAGSLVAPSYHFQDARHGHKEGVERYGEAVRLYGRHSADANLEDVTLSPPDDAVIDAGFHHFIRSNWDRIATGSKIEFEFAFPTRSRFLKLRLKRENSDQDGVMQLKMEAASRFLRMLSDPVQLSYCLETRRLLVYEGDSNIRDHNGDAYEVRIEFEYPDAG